MFILVSFRETGGTWRSYGDLEQSWLGLQNRQQFGLLHGTKIECVCDNSWCIDNQLVSPLSGHSHLWLMGSESEDGMFQVLWNNLFLHYEYVLIMVNKKLTGRYLICHP